MNNIIKMAFGIIALMTISIQSLYSQLDGDDIVIGKHRVIHSDILKEDRLLYIHLPSDYHDSQEKFPIFFQLYSHFTDAYFLPVVRTLDQMYAHGKAPGMILVGIKNQEFRYRDLLPEDHYRTASQIDAFMDFFEKELVPFIESNYRTKDFRILSGPQAGASFGVYAMSKCPDLFNAYFLSSPFWVTSSRETLIQVLSEAVESVDFSRKFVMVSPDERISGAERETLKEFKKLMEEIKSPDFQFTENVLEPGFDFSVSTDVKTGMQTLFRDFGLPVLDDPQPIEMIVKYYSLLSDKYGFEVSIPVMVLAKEGDRFDRRGKYSKSLEIFEKMYELYPTELMSLDRLGSAYRKTGEYGLSLEYYNKFLELQPLNPRVLGIMEQIKSEMNTR